MSDQPSPEEMLKQQKANCIFCKIIAGEIPSRKVFEDEKIIAILDINPAVKGHVLVMTKEHYPIMPLIPPEEFEHLFGTTAALSGMVTKAMIAQRCTTFIANGAVAGQQSPHFLFHLVPREKGDGLGNFSIPKRGINQSDLEQVMKQNLYAIMRQHLTKTGKLGLMQIGQAIKEPPKAEMITSAAVPHAPVPTTQEAPAQSVSQPTPIIQRPRPTPDQLATIIEENPELKALIVNNPEKLKQIITQNSEFQQIFAGIDIHQLSERISKSLQLPEDATPNEEQKTSQEEYEQPAQESEEIQTDDLRPAVEMTMQELFTFIDKKPRLQEYILEAPNELKQIIPENDRLRRFFEGSNINAIIFAYREYHLEREAKREAEEWASSKPATQMTMHKLFMFIDEKKKLRHLILYDPEGLKEIIPKNSHLEKFFTGSNVNAIIQAYQEHAKKQGVHITVEPEDKKQGIVRQPEGPSRQESWDAYEEMRDGTHSGTMSRGPPR